MAKAKPIEGLDCRADARDGVRLVLTSRFDEMCSYAEAARAPDDVEGVHDMRVASRRLRSALRDFAPYLRRSKRLDAARAELKRLADALGEVRDMDVSAIAIEEMAEEAPEGSAARIRLVAEARREERREASAELARTISDEALAEARQLLTRGLKAATAAAPRKRAKKNESGDDEDRPTFDDAGREIVARSWEELRELSAGLYRPLKAKRLHKMRIAAKRLRYTLELYSACWGAEAKRLADEISELQDALGEMHDCDEWMKEAGARLSGSGDDRTGLGAAGRDALVWMLEHFVKERTRYYREALRLWHEWERDDFASRIAACAEGSEPSPQTREPA